VGKNQKWTFLQPLTIDILKHCLKIFLFAVFRLQPLNIAFRNLYNASACCVNLIVSLFCHLTDNDSVVLYRTVLCNCYTLRVISTVWYVDLFGCPCGSEPGSFYGSTVWNCLHVWFAWQEPIHTQLTIFVFSYAVYTRDERHSSQLWRFCVFVSSPSP